MHAYSPSYVPSLSIIPRRLSSSFCPSFYFWDPYPLSLNPMMIPGHRHAWNVWVSYKRYLSIRPTVRCPCSYRVIFWSFFLLASPTSLWSGVKVLSPPLHGSSEYVLSTRASAVVVDRDSLATHNLRFCSSLDPRVNWYQLSNGTTTLPEEAKPNSHAYSFNNNESFSPHAAA
ncbi:MAG: hypothetical protein J3R72DRAFT_31127 [Linnemannia gamsii]|nr:MAG: hypothetical protein J3R72DRAFT_31127 [Linnemannia gamsii]